ITQITFSLSGTGISIGNVPITIKRPDGSTVLPNDVNVSFVSLSTGVIFSILTPAVGNWNVILSGTGPFALNISGESPLDLASFRFVEAGGRPGHEGFFPITGL